jgi:putative FmdB family regulatory protein
MPRYEFLCEKCQKPFELIMTISEREKAKPKCPTCKGTKVEPQFSGFMAQTQKKSWSKLVTGGSGMNPDDYRQRSIAVWDAMAAGETKRAYLWDVSRHISE